MKYETISRADDIAYMTPVEAAKHWKVKRHVIWNAISTGRIQWYRFKALTLVKVEDVKREMEKGKRVEEKLEWRKPVKKTGKRCPSCKGTGGHYANCRTQIRKEVR